MALCTRCGQPTRPDVGYCIACGGEVVAIGAYSGARSRVADSSASHNGPRSQRRFAAWAEIRAATDPLRQQGPDRGQFRFQQLASTAVVDQSPPLRTAVEQNGQFRYDRALSVPPPYRPPTADRADSLLPLPPALSPVPGPMPASPGRQPRSPVNASGRGQTVHSRRGPAPHRARPTGGTHHRRTGALAVTRAALFIAGVVAIVLAVHYGAPSQAVAARTRATGLGPAGAASPSRPAAVDNVVTVEPGAATAPHEAAVVAFLDRYFSAINRHAFRAYKRLFTPALRSGLSAATFGLGYGSTRDSAETVGSINVIGAGQVEAIVTVTSRQQPGDSPGQSSCMAWRMSLSPIQGGSGYLLAALPDAYQPSSRSCS
jgi:hypothetical protein